MYPGHFYHPYRGHRFFPRIIWFFIGGAAATWYHNRRALDERIATYGERGMFGHCNRHQTRPVVAPPAASSPVAPMVEAPPYETNVEPVNVTARFDWGHNSDQKREADQWEEERQKFRAFSAQAADAMTDLSESTLDSLASTVDTLRTKLAEHKAQREKQQRFLEQQLQEQKRLQEEQRSRRHLV